MPVGFVARKKFVGWLDRDFAPLMGGEGEDENADDKDTSDDDSSEDNTEDHSSEDDDSSDDDDADDDPVAPLQSTIKDLEKRLKAAEQAAANAKKEAKEARAESANKTGNFKQVAQERLAHIEELTEELATANARADKAEGTLNENSRTVRVVSIAQRLGYKDPADAMSLLQAEERRLRAAGKDEDESDLTGDDATVERALRKMADKKKYLVDEKRATGRPMNGGSGKAGGLTMDRIRQMSQEEIVANMDEVNKVLEAEGASTG
jgi:hypothetical protein